MGKKEARIHLSVSEKHCRAELEITGTDKANSIGSKLAKALSAKEDALNKKYGRPGKLTWRKTQSSLRIGEQLDGVNIWNDDDWPRMINFLVNRSDRLAKTFRDEVKFGG